MLREQELNEKLESLTEEDIENLEGDELCELVERVYGEQEEDEECEEPKRHNLSIHVGDDETRGEVFARTVLKPEVRAATTAVSVGIPGFDSDELELNEIIGELNKQTAQLKQKDLSRAESMMSAQAHTLDLLFNKLVTTAAANMGQYLEATETYFKLALKSQSQCRATMEALAKIQNPPVTNVTKQTNIAKNQQINNDGQIENSPNELLEKTDGQRLDTRAPREAVDPYSNVETLETVNRAKIARG